MGKAGFRSSLWAGLLISSLYFSDQAISSEMTPIEVYSRCHLQLSATVPDPSSQIYKDVLANKISAAEGCARVFDLAKFNSNGVMKNQSSELARKVLERVHHIHRNWFAQRAPVGLLNESFAINDMEEPALYLTRSAFHPNARFSDVVTLNSGLKGIRVRLEGGAVPYVDTTAYLNKRSTHPDNFPNHVVRVTLTQFPVSNNNSIAASHTTVDLNPSALTQFGHLVGITTPPAITVPRLRVAELLNPSNLRPQMLQHLKTVRLNRHFGGGLLGSQGYIITNTNLSRAQLPLEETRIHRRLTSRIHEDLMCHQFPNLKVSDVQSEVISSSPHSFRQSTSCMQCHSTIDPAAQTYRNVFMSFTRGDVVELGFRPDFIMNSPVLNASNAFHTQTPRGRLKYRTLLQNKLVSKNVSSIQQIGNHIASSDDFYLCSAKKYYKYFTGVDVQLDSLEKSGTAKALHQNQVINLSKKLKSSQSIRETLKSLFSSSIYQSRDFLAQEVSE